MSRLWLLLLVACASPSPVATGEVGDWQVGPQLPVARANHCAVAIGDWVVVVGGNHAVGSGFAAIDEIDAAQVSSDGTLGPWQVAGHLPSPASEPTCTSDGRTLYVIDGIYDNADDGGQVWTATLDSGGTLSPLTSLGHLPDGVVAIASGAHVANNTLVLTHAELPNEGDTLVTLHTHLPSLSWSMDDWHIGFHAMYETAFTPSSVYVLGGYHDPAVGALADTYVGSLAAGALTSVAPSSPLPAPVAFGSAVAVDGWLFVTGGRGQVFGAPGTTEVYAAPIGTGGALGSWQTTTALPLQRTNHSVVVVGDFLVLAGGAASGPGDTNVLTSRVRF
jgi:hypothetical protein